MNVEYLVALSKPHLIIDVVIGYEVTTPFFRLRVVAPCDMVLALYYNLAMRWHRGRTGTPCGGPFPGQERRETREVGADAKAIWESVFEERKEGWETTTDKADIDFQNTVTDMVSVSKLARGCQKDWDRLKSNVV